MINPAYPQHPFRIREEGGAHQIFDDGRKCWVRLTPEEWVRQNCYQWMVQVLQYPAALMAIEKEITLFERKKRFDLLVFDSHHKPWMLVECKAQSVPINDRTLTQALHYHMAVPVQHILLTNGITCRLLSKTETSFEEKLQMPLHQ